ncbi:MAG: FxsA family protein [Acidimicrobiales bacterium]
MFAVLFLAFVVLPVLEVYVIVQVAGGIGWPEAIALVILVSVVGAFLVRLQGFAIWGRFQAQLAAGRMPSNELVDGGLVLVAATLMLTPGFITDAVGLFLLVPFTRALVRRPVLSRIRFRAENYQAYRVWNGAAAWRNDGSGPVVDTDGYRTDRGDDPYDDGDPAPEIER